MSARDPLSTPPEKIDPAAWSLADSLVGTTRTCARRALRDLADRGWPTNLNAVLSAEDLMSLTSSQRHGLRRLWHAAKERGLRTEGVPLSKREERALHAASVDPSVPAPTNVDTASWALTAVLEGWRCELARTALKKLARLKCGTDLNIVVSDVMFQSIGSANQRALRALWTAAQERGDRTAAIPAAPDLYLTRKDLIGIDASVIAFARKAVWTNRHPAMFAWLRGLRDAGLPTDFDADLDSSAARDVYTTLIERAGRRALYGGRNEVNDVRASVRRLYECAVAARLRQLPIPAYIVLRGQYLPGTGDALLARLPEGDRARLDEVRAHLLDLNRRQQAGQMKPEKRKPGTKKKTEAQSTSRAKLSALSSFLHHAEQWERMDRDVHASEIATNPKWESSWRIERGLEALLTPPQVAWWCFRGHKPDGSPKEMGSIEKQQEDFIRLLERAEEAGHALVPKPQREQIAAELERFAANEEWNVPTDTAWRPSDHADDETGKWFPTLALLRSGIATLRERYAEARARRSLKRGTWRQFWMDTRDFVLAYGTLVCMWRVDTACTIDLSRLAPDPQTGRKRWRDGSIHVRLGARAKQAGDRSYFVPDLLIPAEVVDLIEELLKLEGRTLEQPLARGERAVELAVGDRWGRDALLHTGRTVVPLFRLTPDRPNGLQYEGIAKSIEASLFAMGWDAVNPHTMRAGGAILWRYIRGISLAAIMRLGLWTEETTLKRCYAHLNVEDLDLEIARGGDSPNGPTETTPLTRELDDVQRVALALRLQIAPTAVDLAAAARTMARTVAALERAAGIAAAPTFPSKLKNAGDYAVLDGKVRALTKDGSGLNQLLGYEVIAAGTAPRRTPRGARRSLADVRERLERLRPVASSR